MKYPTTFQFPFGLITRTVGYIHNFDEDSTKEYKHPAARVLLWMFEKSLVDYGHPRQDFEDHASVEEARYKDADSGATLLASGSEDSNGSNSSAIASSTHQLYGGWSVSRRDTCR